MYRFFFKRVVDLILSFSGLMVLFPVFVIISILLCVVNNGTPFFLQCRPGRSQKLFFIIKFKTMNDKKDSQGNLLCDDKRLTRVGAFVRKTSLDEIPQLINVLKGDMSLIGPRPLLPEYLSLYNLEQNKRHNVRPGITGWAQVNGRNAISWGKKFEYDVWYVDNLTFFLDVKIFFKTILKVFKSEGINTQGQATTQAFNGQN